jgi:hypothetical protein
MQLFAVRGISVYATYESRIERDFAMFTPIGASYISDNLIALRYSAEIDGGPSPRITRLLAVVKCRGSMHDDRLRPMTIGERGVEVAVNRRDEE